MEFPHVHCFRHVIRSGREAKFTSLNISLVLLNGSILRFINTVFLEGYLITRIIILIMFASHPFINYLHYCRVILCLVFHYVRMKFCSAPNTISWSVFDVVFCLSCVNNWTFFQILCFAAPKSTLWSYFNTLKAGKFFSFFSNDELIFTVIFTEAGCKVFYVLINLFLIVWMNTILVLIVPRGSRIRYVEWVDRGQGIRERVERRKLVFKDTKCVIGRKLNKEREAGKNSHEFSLENRLCYVYGEIIWS